MKVKLFRVIVPVALSISLVSFPSVNFSSVVHADEKPTIDSVPELQAKVVSELKKDNPTTDDQVDSSIDKVYEENTVNIDTKEFQDKEILPDIDKPSEDLGTGQEVNLDDYVDENIDNGNFVEETINDNVSVIFTDGPAYFVNITEETPTLSNTNVLYARAATKNTKTITHTYTAKGYVLGQTLFKVGVKGYFSYNHSKVTPHFVDAWYRRGNLSIWQVSGWSHGTLINSANHGEVYGKGNFHYGAEYQGIGLTVEDVYVKVYIRGDKNGKTWSGQTIK
mgnify:CR=1 FL=1